jgi:glucose-6-phosphate 1-epimerase
MDQTASAKLIDLQDRFAVPGILAFEATASGLVFARITAPAAEATVYLYGAHLTHWRPTGHDPVLFLSPRSELAPGKAIRGGVPVIFPWFGPRANDPQPGGKPSPAHGFARTTEWELAFAAVAGDEVHLTCTLSPNEASRALGFDHFRLAYRVIVGASLTLELTVANDSTEPLAFEEALHTYFAVGDVRQASVMGLGGTAYLDKRDDFKRKVQPEGPLVLTGTTDRVYLETAATCEIDDALGQRTITVEKAGSHTTVVWNPWAELAATMSDLPPDAWPGMLCVETANVGESAVSLAPGMTHTMRAHISVGAHK